MSKLKGQVIFIMLHLQRTVEDNENEKGNAPHNCEIKQSEQYHNERKHEISGNKVNIQVAPQALPCTTIIIMNTLLITAQSLPHYSITIN